MPQLHYNRETPLEDFLPTVAFVARSLSDANRRRILLCVNEAKKSVSGIVEELNLRHRWCPII